MTKLKKFVNWKLTHSDKVATAEGYPLTMQNCKANKKMKQLEIYGNSIQDGTPTPDNPIEVESVGERTVNLFDISKSIRTIHGLTVSENADGSYNLRGNIKQNYAYLTDYQLDIPISNGTTITISSYFETSIIDACVGIVCRNASGTILLQGNAISNSGYKTLTVTDDVTTLGMVWRLPSSVAGDYVEINNLKLQLQLGSTVTPYEPYGKYKIPVVQRGVNLFSMAKTSLTEQTVNGITFTPLDDERIHIKGKVIDASKDTVYNPTLGNRNQKIKAGIYRIKRYSAELTQMISVYNNGNFVVNINASHSSTSVLKDGYLSSVYVSVLKGNTREWDDIIEIQLMKGTKNLPYEPYVEPTTTNIFLNEPLRKIGDYADYVDFKNNKVVRCIRCMNGEQITKLTINKYSSTSFSVTNTYRFKPGLTLVSGSQKSLSLVMSNMFTDGKYVSRNEVTGVGYSEDGFVYFRFDDEDNYGVADVASFKGWLTQYNPLLYFALQTPTEEPITCELPKLNAKTTIIEADTNLAPSNAYGKYIKR